MLSQAQQDAHKLALKRITREFGRHPGWSSLLLAAGTFQTVMTILFAALLARVLHTLIIDEQAFAELHQPWLLILLCVVLRALAGIVREEAGTRISLAVRARLRSTLIDALTVLVRPGGKNSNPAV